MNSAFLSKLQTAQTGRSAWAVYLSPRLETLPLAIARHDDPFLPYMRAIYAATQTLVCAYVFDFAAYLALGAAGTVALERSIRVTGDEHLTILDARFGSEAFASVWEETAFGVDGVTVAANVPLDAYSQRADRQAFTVCDDPCETPAFSPQHGRFTGSGIEIRLLPLDILYRARSLDFESTLHELTGSYVRA